MFKNVASQKAIVFAFDSTTNLPKTGDAANITAYVSKDYGSVTVLGDTSATEMDSTNGKGYYLFDLTQAETNADTLLFSAKSSTSNIVVVGVPATVFTTPANFSSQSINGSGQVDVIKVAGTTQTARDIGLSVLLAANQHVIVDSGTVTTLTNLPSIPNNWLTAAGIAASALNGKGDWSTYAGGAVASVTGDVGGKVLGGGAGVLSAIGVQADVQALKASTAALAVMAAFYGCLETGTAQTGGASTITLRAGASSVNDYFKDQAIVVLSGTGLCQTNRITAYNGTTKVATVEQAWATQPDNTSVYVVAGRIS